MMRFLLICGFWAISNSAIADPLQDIRNCNKIADDNQRLACYDLISSKLANKQDSAQAATIAASKATETKQATEKSGGLNKTGSEKLQPNTQSQDAFGKPDTQAVTSIESRMIGQFKGWVKGNKIRLENGQIWKVTGKTRGYIKIDNPNVIISRGILGSYDMTVEGFKLSGKVKRIK